MLNEHPHIVYPGNLQGRSPRETGAKGATIVTVSDGEVAHLEHHDLDVVRWFVVTVDVAETEGRTGLIDQIRNEIEEVCNDAGDRALAIRLRLVGETNQHQQLLIEQQILREDIAVLLATLAQDIWLEKIVIATKAPPLPSSLDPTVSGQLAGKRNGGRRCS